MRNPYVGLYDGFGEEVPALGAGPAAGIPETAGQTEGMKKIGVAEIQLANGRLQKYKSAKTKLDTLIRDAEQWFAMAQKKYDGKRKREIRRTNWLMSSIVQKHADFMDNVPEVTVLPREKSDQASADALTGMLPAIMERGKWEETYNTCCWHKVKYGFGVYAVLFDTNASNGIGDIAYRAIDPLTIFWEPGVKDLQDSRDVFIVSIQALEDVKRQYANVPEVAELNAGVTEQPLYLHDNTVDTSDKVSVIDWYYKKDGAVHLTKYVGDVVLSSTENDGAAGIYADGRYPFVIDRFLPDETGPAGIGLYQLGIDTQKDLDDTNDLFMRSLRIGSRPRYFSASQGGVNEEEFRDLDCDIVHVAGATLDDRYLRPIDVQPLPAIFENLYEAKVNELKENTYNREVNAGGSSGTRTASGIAALQEAGSKTSRDAIRNTYRAFMTIVDMTIERIREFYDAPRSYRILGPNGESEYQIFDNSQIAGGSLGDFGEELGQRKPIFDYDVRISKQSVYARAANNQEIMSFYQMGFFKPENAREALACLDVLQLDNKGKLTEIIKQNSLLEQFKAQILPVLLQAAGQVDPQLMQAAYQAAAAAGLVGAPVQSAPVTNAAPTQTMSYMDRQRAVANERSSPQ